jgi:parallel beta-helix repeat protein
MTVIRLLKALGPGATGCLRAGRYDQNVTVLHGGTAHAPLVLRSFPHEVATIRGRLYVSRHASYTIFEYLALDGIDHGHACGFPCPSPSVNADHTTFSHDDVTDEHTAICFVLGDANGQYGSANHTVIEQNRIHDCGQLPPTNHEHGIYVENSIGSAILDNYIYNNADRGIQLYPEAEHTLIRGNLIDGNGEGIDFGAAGRQTSSHNLVADNVIINSRVVGNVVSFYGPNDTVGTGNVVIDNCIGGGARDDVNTPSGIATVPAVALIDNVPASPESGTASIASGVEVDLAAGSTCPGRVGRELRSAAMSLLDSTGPRPSAPTAHTGSRREVRHDASPTR